MLDDYRTLEELMEVERELCDRLDQQVNDLSELHQNEVANIKQVSASAVCSAAHGDVAKFPTFLIYATVHICEY